LGLLGEKARLPDVVDALFDCLLDEHTEPGMVSPFAEALASIGDPQTIPRALQLIEQGEWRVAHVIDQLVEGFGASATFYLSEALKRIDNRYRPLVIEALGSTRDQQAVETLLQMLDSEAEHKSAVIGALGMLRSPLALPKLLEQLQVPAEPYIITKILWALDLIGDVSVAPELLSYLSNHTFGSLSAIRMLGEFKYVPAVPYLIGRLSNRVARADVIIALARIGTLEALSALARLVSRQEMVGLPENLDPAVLEAIEALRTDIPTG
jgi:HEAT repeat protein